MTESKRILWSVLSGRKCGGLKFRRPHSIEPYIDFYCPQANLVAEIDGGSHEDRQDDDRRRDRFLERLGLTIMYVTNEDVTEGLDGVVEAILRVAGRARGDA